MPEAGRDEEPDRQRVSLELKWRDPGELPTLFANQLYVTHASNDEFYIVFGEVQIPPFGAALPESIEVKPVAKVVLTPEFMKNVAEVVAKNYRDWLFKQDDEKG